MHTWLEVVKILQCTITAINTNYGKWDLSERVDTYSSEMEQLNWFKPFQPENIIHWYNQAITAVSLQQNCAVFWVFISIHFSDAKNIAYNVTAVYNHVSIAKYSESSSNLCI